jgi:hypothetical protein
MITQEQIEEAFCKYVRRSYDATVILESRFKDFQAGAEWAIEEMLKPDLDAPACICFHQNTDFILYTKDKTTKGETHVDTQKVQKQ